MPDMRHKALVSACCARKRAFRCLRRSAALSRVCQLLRASVINSVAFPCFRPEHGDRRVPAFPASDAEGPEGMDGHSAFHNRVNQYEKDPPRVDKNVSPCRIKLKDFNLFAILTKDCFAIYKIGSDTHEICIHTTGCRAVQHF